MDVSIGARERIARRNFLSTRCTRYGPHVGTANERPDRNPTSRSMRGGMLPRPWRTRSVPGGLLFEARLHDDDLTLTDHPTRLSRGRIRFVLVVRAGECCELAYLVGGAHADLLANEPAPGTKFVRSSRTTVSSWSVAAPTTWPVALTSLAIAKLPPNVGIAARRGRDRRAGSSSMPARAIKDPLMPRALELRVTVLSNNASPRLSVVVVARALGATVVA